MIRPSYALKLARTKLRSKRGTLIASIIVSSMLFATLIAAIIVFTGAEKSATEFIKKSGNDLYLVKTNPNIPYEKLSFQAQPTLQDIREIRDFEKKYYNELRIKYRSLSIEYDEKLEIPALTPSASVSEALPEEQRVMINFSSPVVQEMERQRSQEYIETAANKLSDLKQAGETYSASGYYLVDKPSKLPSMPNLRLVYKGKEDFADSELKAGDFTSYGYFTNSIHNGNYSFTDQRLLDRYLLTTDASDLKGIPVVVSAQEATSLFSEEVGIDKEPKTASEKKVWLKEVQSKLNGHIYQACHRNEAEQTILEKIQRDYAEIKNNEGNKEYMKPNVIYGYPMEACGDIIVKEDTRTSAEKQAEIRIQAAQERLGTYVPPMHRLLTFQIVGIKYAQPYTDYTKGVDEYVKSLLAPQDDAWSLNIPLQMYESLPEELKINYTHHQESNLTPTQQVLASEELSARVLEFTSVENARAFLENETCLNSEINCDKKFLATPYGSNYLILDEIEKMFSRITAISFPVVAGLAAVIVWFTISRIMAENRKETAVYRAMGAKRRDIIVIYITYVLLVALRIALVSLVIGTTTAFGIDYFFGESLTDIATISFGVIDGAPRFSLFRITSPLFLTVIGLIFTVSILASIQPLIRNVRRSPIHDMRVDT